MELIYLGIFIGLTVFIILSFIAGKAIGKRHMFEVMQDVIKKERKDAVDKSRSILKGQFTEQLSPFYKDFPVKASEARFFGAPLDFIAFVGLDEKDVKEIVFIEVKSGNAQMNKTERSIKKAIDEKKVRFETYRMN